MQRFLPPPLIHATFDTNAVKAVSFDQNLIQFLLGKNLRDLMNQSNLCDGLTHHHHFEFRDKTFQIFEKGKTT